MTLGTWGLFLHMVIEREGGQLCKFYGSLPVRPDHIHWALRDRGIGFLNTLAAHSEDLLIQLRKEISLLHVGKWEKEKCALLGCRACLLP